MIVNPVYVINAQGKRELFSLRKVYRSARYAGALPKDAKAIAEVIGEEIAPGTTTAEIFRKVRKLLDEKNSGLALRFSLKEAMKKLGPDGFSFEKYVAKIFEALGFQVEINQDLPGSCIIGYEIDFVATKDNLIYIGECKYRNAPGDRIDSKEILANSARFADILNGPYFKKQKNKGTEIKSIMVTNTKFTSRAKEYSRCMGVELLGWRYPENKGLEYLIEQKKLYPITILPSLKGYLRDVFISHNILLAKDVLGINGSEFSLENNIPSRFINSLIKEASLLV
ncbi:MAG: restriction endonuclease [bacterium]